MTRLHRIERREFLGAVSAAGLGVLGGGLAHAAQSVGGGARRIDVHHHYAPPAWTAALTARNLAQAVFRNWTPARTIEAMDRADVATAVQSITTPGVWFGDDAAARRLARECNEYGARMVADYPGRFGLFAILPLPDVDGSLAEIAYTLDVLKADGVCVLSSVGGKWLGDASFAPVFEELNRRRTVLYTHATTPNCCRGLVPNLGDTVIEYGTDTTRAIASLLTSGTAAASPNLRFVFSHGGGTAPYLLGRFQQAFDQGQRAKQLPNGFRHELNRFYYDTAWAFNPVAMAALSKLVPITQILYGTDFPYTNMLDVAKGLEDTGVFTTENLQAVGRDNARALLPKFA